ncbi:hypothetical protein [Rhodococcus ruber]
MNRSEAQFTALLYFALDGTDDPSCREQASMIRRYITWRNKPAADERLHEIVDRANIASYGTGRSHNEDTLTWLPIPDVKSPARRSIRGYRRAGR